ncbi:MAG TPA: 30S ribosomal protein S17 [Candidatus Absconditabacterales bacterium]|nr:30S ribosomal protein S17 [Candidatus Absconditabacterales bacterium]
MVVIGNKSIKEFVGEVISDKTDKTRTILVKTVKMHPLYKKRFIVRKKYYAHDEENASKLGDMVKIRECRPVSKLKKWKLIEVTKA